MSRNYAVFLEHCHEAQATHDNHHKVCKWSNRSNVEGQSARYRVSVAPGLPEKITKTRDGGNVEGQNARYRVRVAPGLPEEGTAARDVGCGGPECRPWTDEGPWHSASLKQ